MAKELPCGPDVEPIVQAVQEYADAGLEKLYISQIGELQDEFFDFYQRELQSMLADI